MAAEQSMTHATMQAAIKSAKADIMAIREAGNPVNITISVYAVPRSEGTALKWPTIDWEESDKYQKLCILETEVKTIFLTNSYNTQEGKRVPIILNGFGREGQGLCRVLATRNKKSLKQAQDCLMYCVKSSSPNILKNICHYVVTEIIRELTTIENTNEVPS